MSNPKAENVSAHDFCVAWMESKNVKEVVTKTGLKSSTVSQRASTLRKKGVPLKFFAMKSPRNDYDALAALVKGYDDAEPEAEPEADIDADSVDESDFDDRDYA